MVQTFLSARKWMLFVLVFVAIFCINFSLINTKIAFAAEETYEECLDRIGRSTEGVDALCASKKGGGLKTEVQKATDILLGITVDEVARIPAAASELVVMLLSFGLWLAGVFFNFIVDETIVRAAQGALGSNSSNVLRPGIETAWKLIRDLINMSFIFILLYQSIQLILGRTNEAGKTIIKVAAVAILINFSIFITQVVVDASNIVAIGFYDAFTTVPAAAPDAGDTALERGYAGGISNAYMNALGLQSTWDGLTKALTVLVPGTASTTMLTLNILMGLLLIVTTFIFIAAGIMLLVRYIMIIFLVILSPLAFAGIILPGTQQYTKQWWETLTGQAIFAPAFMIMTWVNLTLIGSLYSNPDRQNFGNLFKTLAEGSISNIGVETLGAVFNFTLIIGTAIASLVIAKRFANQGGKGFGTLTNYIGGAALGGAAWAGRRTVGRYAQNLSNNAAFREKMGRSVFGNLALKTVDRTATGSFDTRGTRLGGTVFEGMGKAGGAGGYRKSFEDNVKKRQEFAEKYASASKDTTDAYEKAKSDVRAAKRVYLNATTPEARMAAYDDLKAKEKESKKQKARYEAETKRSKAEYAQTASTMDILRPHVGFAPSGEALEAADRIMDNLEGSDKDATKKQDIEDKKSIYTGLVDAGDTTRAVDFLDNLSIKDKSEMPIKYLVGYKKDPAGGEYLDIPLAATLIPSLEAEVLNTARRKGELKKEDLAKIKSALKLAPAYSISYHPTVEKMKGTANGIFWGLKK